MENKPRGRKLLLWQDVNEDVKKKPFTIQTEYMVFARGVFLNIKYMGAHILVLQIVFLAGIGVCSLFHGI